MTEIINETELSAAEVFVATLKALPSMVQRTDLVTVKMVNPDSRTPGGLYTSKDKKVLGIPDGNETTWVPFHLPVHDNTKFEVLAKSIDRKGYQLAAEILQKWYNDNIDVISEIVSDKLKEEKSVEDLEKEMLAIQRRMELVKAKIADKKG